MNVSTKCIPSASYKRLVLEFQLKSHSHKKIFLHPSFLLTFLLNAFTVIQMVLECLRSSRNNFQDLKNEFSRFNKKNGGGGLSLSELKKGFSNLKVRHKLLKFYVYTILYSFMFHILLCYSLLLLYLSIFIQISS